MVAFGYAKSARPDIALTDAMIREARYAIDIAGTACAATVHLQAPRQTTAVAEALSRSRANRRATTSS
jgi:hypothetical protein